MIDVGVGVERELGISREKLTQALALLEAEGYGTYGGGVPQVTNPEDKPISKYFARQTSFQPKARSRQKNLRF